MNKSPWKELKTTKKRPFFYNIKTKKSTWVMPEELKQIRRNMAKKRETKFNISIGKKTGIKSKINVSISNNKIKNDKFNKLSDEEAERRLLQLFKEKGINPKDSWQ